MLNYFANVVLFQALTKKFTACRRLNFFQNVQTVIITGCCRCVRLSSSDGGGGGSRGGRCGEARLSKKGVERRILHFLITAHIYGNYLNFF